jgi:hypothetical protein
MENQEVKNEMQDTRPLNDTEFEAFSFDMDELLKKHNCEIGVVSTIKIMKRVDKIQENKEEGIKSPFVPQPNNGTDENKA